MTDPTGEADRGALRLDFDRHLMFQFHGSTITSDAGPLAYRELDDTLQLTDMAADKLADARTGKSGRHRLAGLLRQSMFGRRKCIILCRAHRRPVVLRRLSRMRLHLPFSKKPSAHQLRLHGVGTSRPQLKPSSREECH
jgi:hypothetical protein